MTLTPPDDLGAPGRAFWEDLTTAYELDPGAEAALAHEAARITDELGRLVAALADAPMVVPGSAGQDRPHPLLDELRKHRQSLVTVVGALRLPADGEKVGKTPASVRAQAAARARWAPSAIDRSDRKGGRNGAAS